MHGCHDQEGNLVYRLAAEYQHGLEEAAKNPDGRKGVHSWTAAGEHCEIGVVGKPLLDRVGEGYSSGWAVSDECTW